ncbi:Exonuclease mut-7 -like protein [Triplophysa tibetana]|uniref:Exonuclease mut-7-like protein n=1 Tax=Triplophysa tibetana TaxID=1572043 RepID=A0A5A9N168_9TELE|nr:Exonuclease mut-7 -like protein [Triplophysa tibetana]
MVIGEEIASGMEGDWDWGGGVGLFDRDRERQLCNWEIAVLFHGVTLFSPNHIPPPPSNAAKKLSGCAELFQDQQGSFSRTHACNCDEYLKLPREDMTRMMKERGLLQNIVPKRYDCMPQAETQGDYNSWRPPQGPQFTPHCRWAPHTALDPQTLKFPSGAEVQIETVPPGLLPRIPVYFICTGCGKVFWEGTHFDRVLSQFQEVLHIEDGATNFCYSILALSLLGRKARLFPTLLEHVVLGLNWTQKALPLLRRHASSTEFPAHDSGGSALSLPPPLNCLAQAPKTSRRGWLI